MEVCVCVCVCEVAISVLCDGDCRGLQKSLYLHIITHDPVCLALLKSSAIPKRKSCTIACIMQLTMRTSDPETSGAQHSTAQHSTAQHSTAQHLEQECGFT